MKPIVVLLTLFSLNQWQNGKTQKDAYGCPAGSWFRSMDRCYYISDNVDNFDGANKYCKDRKSQLAPALTLEAHIDLIEVLASYRAKCLKGQNCEEFWMGIKNLTETNWRTGNDLIIEKDRQCQQWAKGFPRGNGTCGIMSLRGTWKNGVWKNVDCTTKYKYVCITCPNGFDYIPEINECFYLSLKLATWDDGQKKCAKMKRGARLMTIHDSTKQKALENYLKLQLTRQETDICIFSEWTVVGKLMYLGGQTKIPMECKTPTVWKQLGAPDEPLTYANWFPGRPDCHIPGETCVTLPTSPMFNFRWEDMMCTHLLCYLCEF